MNSSILLLSLLFCFSFATILQERQTATYTAATVTNSMERIIQIVETPAGDPRFVEITGIEANANPTYVTLDAVQFNLTTYNQTTLSFGYIHEVAQQNGMGGEAEAFFFAMRSFYLFEFINQDGVPGFQQSNGSNADKVVSAYDLSNPGLPWNGIIINSTQLVAPNGTPFKVTYIEADTADGVFSFRYTVTEQPVYVNGVLITADQAKIDVGIRYYSPGNLPAAWSTGPSNATAYPNAQIGYIAVTFSEEVFAAFMNGTSSGQNSQVAFGSGAVVGTFDWQPTAQVTVNGEYVNGAVYAQVTDQSESFSATVSASFSLKFLLFSFEGFRPSYVYWDPVFGANILYTTTSSAVTSAICLYLTLLACFVTLL